MRLIFSVIFGFSILFGETHATELPNRLWYQESARYRATIRADTARMINTAPRGCAPPFKIYEEFPGIPLTITIRNDTTRETLRVRGRLASLVPFTFYPSCEIELINPLDLRNIELERRRVKLDMPSIAQTFFVKTDLFYVWVTGSAHDSLDLTIRLESVENPKKYCPVIYRVTGKRRP